jgi:hypothetical protein
MRLSHTQYAQPSSASPSDFQTPKSPSCGLYIKKRLPITLGENVNHLYFHSGGTLIMLILKLVALLGLLVQPFSEAAPAGTNSGQCPWDPTQQPFSCTLYAKPNPFPGGTGSVYLVNGVTDTNNCYKNPTASTPNNCYQQGAVNAIDKTMKIYSLLFGSTYLGAATLSVKVYIVNEVNAPPFQDVHAVTKDGGGGNCITQISINFPKGGGPRPLPNFQEILAHELYHCVQYALNKPPVRVDDTPVPWGWWYEGTAEWFANIVYPGAKETISYFDPNFSIYNLPIFDPDTAALFFAYMDKAVFNPASVHGWMVNQKYSTSFGNELTRISKDVQLVPAFPGFADAYFDQKISYYNGGLITESLYTNFAPKPINLPTDASYTFQLTLDIVPWTVNTVYTATFKRIRMSLSNFHLIRPMTMVIQRYNTVWTATLNGILLLQGSPSPFNRQPPVHQHHVQQGSTTILWRLQPMTRINCHLIKYTL